MAEMTTIAPYTSRELPAEEWEKLRSIPPYDSMGLPSTDGDWKVFVVEDADGALIATTATQVQVHWEPWWFREESRKNPVVVRLLLEQCLSTLKEFGIPYAFCTVAEDQPEIRSVVEHLGGIRAPGDLYLVNLDQVSMTLLHKKGTA